jgi:HK97 family phage major capsid protein
MEPKMAMHELRAQRGKLVDDLTAVSLKLDAYKPAKPTTDAEKAAAKTAKTAFDADKSEFDRLYAEVKALDDTIQRQTALIEVSRASAVPAAGQEHTAAYTSWAQPKFDLYTHEEAAEARGLITHKGLALAGVARALSNGRGLSDAGNWAAKNYGEQHPVTKALVAGVGGSGGFIVPPEYINEIIELLRPMTAVRGANPRTMPMPRGTMTLPAQTGAATATYSGETSKIAASQQTLGQIVASYKKLTALVPVSNDLMRYADPAADAFVRDDLTKVMALREDLAFLVGDGTQNTPRGFLSFANEYALQQGGAAGTWLVGSDSTYASGGNFITSNETYTQATVANELAGMVNRLDTANVPDIRRVWFMHPRIYNYLFNLLNSLGLYVYRDELTKGTLLNYPIAKRSTQIPINIQDTNAAYSIASFIFLVEMTDAMILDSMTLELFVSREGSYTDSGGNQVNVVQVDQTLIRAIAEHDFQMRHPASVSVNQGVIWAPAIS